MRYKTTRINRFISICLLLFSALMQLSGCSYARYDTADISKNPSIVYVDINNPLFGVEIIHRAKVNGGREAIISKKVPVIPKIEPGANTTFSMKYYRSLIYSSPNVGISVEFPTGRKYPAYLDTGFNGFIVLTSDIVLDNKLEIFKDDFLFFNDGECHIPVLNIGPAQIKDVMASYEKQQWQFRIMNIPVYKRSAIIIGCSFIKTFDYVLFDNVSQEVVFSKDGAFKPDSPQLWTSFPFSIKPDSALNAKIMVQMPINGHVYELFFDSCGGKPGLNLNEHDWQTIETDLTVKRLRKSHIDLYQSGRVSCQRATVSELSIGEKTIKNAEINISEFPEGSEFSESLSMITLGYFQDTIVVLDFVNNLFWIKR